MNTLLLAVLVGIAYLVAYYTYGRFVARKIFKLDPDADVPSRTMEDGVDYVPTQKRVLFGHHYTSIAGLGPIVGPAVGIIWGWVPAVIWVVFGSIFMGAVHDFGALVVSMRNKGRSIGDLAGAVINRRVRTLFLLIIFFALWIIVAIFAMIIALLFNNHETAVLPVWSQIPIAVVLGYGVYKRGLNPLAGGLVAVALMYLTVVAGASLPLSLNSLLGEHALAGWIVILLVYVFVASTLPVQVLLQPRDYINSFQLIIAMALLAAGTAAARPDIVAPALDASPAGAPPIWPFIFVVIACGAISGFHSLVASGTSPKQCASEKDAQFIGYGSMLLEGALAILVIIAVAGGLGMGLETDGGLLTGTDAFAHHYRSWAAAKGLTAKLGAFIAGGTNMIAALGIPAEIIATLLAVFLVSFAATTLDSATRVQRYVIAELGAGFGLGWLKNKYAATSVAVVFAFVLAFSEGSGKGALTLWPLFGTVNQLLAALTLLVLTIYLAKRGSPIIFTLLPMVFMGVMTGWAMVLKIRDFMERSDYLLLVIGGAVFALEIWMIAECLVLVFGGAFKKGNREDTAPAANASSE